MQVCIGQQVAEMDEGVATSACSLDLDASAAPKGGKYKPEIRGDLTGVLSSFNVAFWHSGRYHAERKEKLLEEGLEPSTLGLLDPRSNQLSYTSC
jgi:hypothetical protein